MLGYGHEVWSAGNYYFWIPMVAPFFGCTFGGWLYDVFIFTGSYASCFFSPLLCPRAFCSRGMFWSVADGFFRRESDQYPLDGTQENLVSWSC